MRRRELDKVVADKRQYKFRYPDLETAIDTIELMQLTIKQHKGELRRSLTHIEMQILVGADECFIVMDIVKYEKL